MAPGLFRQELLCTMRMRQVVGNAMIEFAWRQSCELVQRHPEALGCDRALVILEVDHVRPSMTS